MDAKAKECKGTSAVSVKGCSTFTIFRKYGLCMDCYRDWLLNTPDGKEKLNKATIRATKERRELEQADKREKESRRINYLLTNVKNKVHEYIRLRDKGKPCISCGSNWRDDFQAGHFYKSELYSSLRFEEDNIHGQCPKCNMYDDGNLNKYDLNLPGRIGDVRYDELKSKAAKDKRTNFKWDREELEQIREYYKLKLKEL